MTINKQAYRACSIDLNCYCFDSDDRFDSREVLLQLPPTPISTALRLIVSLQGPHGCFRQFLCSKVVVLSM